MTDDPYNEPVYSIGLAAEKLGVAVPTLRMYEQAGLIIPFKTKTNRRLYSRNDLKRIELIMSQIKEKGMNLAGLRYMCSIIPCWVLTNCPPEIFEKCDSFKNATQPCWMNDKTNCSTEGNECRCRDCETYKMCSEHLKNPKAILSKYCIDSN